MSLNIIPVGYLHKVKMGYFVQPVLERVLQKEVTGHAHPMLVMRSGNDSGFCKIAG
jgi:hypothetical protein